MVQRVRSILVDNTLGKIFTGANTVSNATAANLIAGTQKNIKTFSSAATTTMRVANNLFGGTGVSIGSNGVIVSVTLTAATAPVGSNTVINLKKGNTYSNSSVVGTYSMSSNSPIVLYSTTLNFSSSDNFFVDITQVGSTKSGSGLGVQLGYYSGY